MSELLPSIILGAIIVAALVLLVGLLAFICYAIYREVRGGE